VRQDRSVLDAVAEVHDTVAEPALFHELQRDARVAGERGLPITDDQRVHEELALVDQPGVEGVRGEGRPGDAQVGGSRRLQAAEGTGVEVALAPRIRTPNVLRW